jgi:hypothetical protein
MMYMKTAPLQQTYPLRRGFAWSHRTSFQRRMKDRNLHLQC